ncbi:MAG: uroporphyrinogen-III synthase [Actinobacteria bacterium]|nr:uroporphyrinogen-III synthase [Actinomycetota bacterium]
MADGAGLDGLTVVVTRPADQAAALVRLLEERGAVPVVMPLIEVVDVASPAEIESAVAALTGSDWLVVTSLQAARRVAEAARRSACRIAAVGRTTAAQLPRVDLVPTDQSAAGLLGVFPPAPAGGRALVAQAAAGAPMLVDGLGRLGWRAVRIDTHISRSAVPDARQQLAALSADAVIFTSGSQARAWVEVFGSTAPALVATLGRETERNAEACGLKVDVVATDHSLSGVVRALQGIVKP